LTVTDPLLRDLVAFLDEHRYCGELASDVNDLVTMACGGCGARRVRPVDDERRA
jgi:hypothetical protein